MLRKGALIVQSCLTNGLLLAPENIQIPLLNETGAEVDGLTLLQCRICFTEIDPPELQSHAETFGPFSFGFDIDDLRRVGGLPVHYVPLPQGSHLYGLASQIVAGVADAARALEMLAQIRAQIEKSPTLGMVWKKNVAGTEQNDGVRLNEDQTTVIRSFFDEFERMGSLNFGLTHQKLLAAAACFYPTEHPTRTGKLHYYRQREWRIVECGLMQDGRPLAPRATQAQKQTLLSIDRDFFSKSVKVPSASGRIGEWDTASIAERCRFFSRVGDLDVLSLAKYLVIPDDAELDFQVKKQISQRGVKIIKASDFVHKVGEVEKK
jgi:hypothetical protein